MTTLTARALDWRARLPPHPNDAQCPHAGMAYYRETQPGWITRSCRRCGAPLGPVEPRCFAFVQDGSRRCHAPGRFAGSCRVHAS